MNKRWVKVSKIMWMWEWECMSKCKNASARVRTQVQSLKNMMPRVSDKVWGQETRSEVTTRFWYKGWSSNFTCFSGMYKVVFILVKNKNKKEWAQEFSSYKFDVLKPMDKVQHKDSLFYMSHDNSKWPMLKLGWSGLMTHPHHLWCTGGLMCHVQIVKLPGVLHSTELGIAMCTRCWLNAT